jgi:chromosome segregation ATPase
MRALNPLIHSGGEVSIVRVLLLLAVQQVASTPFCCLDESNQELDPRNGQLVFNQIQKVCSEEGLQCIYITPQCLPEISDEENTLIHVVSKLKQLKPTD